MKYMAGWSYDAYLACPLSIREEIVAVMREEADELEQIRNR